MSYVDLKHLLADLALEAVRDPSRAAWVHPLAAYAAAATPLQPAVLLPRAAGLDHLVEVGLLERSDSRITCRNAFLPHFAYLQRQTARLSAAVDHLVSSALPVGVPADLMRGAALFNARLFFEAHELLELTWRATTGPERDFYHGIVQAAAALYHYEKHNLHGARTLLGKAIRRLDPYPSPFLRVDLESLRRSLAEWQEHLGTRHEPGARPPAMPIIQFVLR